MSETTILEQKSTELKALKSDTDVRTDEADFQLMKILELLDTVINQNKKILQGLRHNQPKEARVPVVKAEKNYFQPESFPLASNREMIVKVKEALNALHTKMPQGYKLFGTDKPITSQLSQILIAIHEKFNSQTFSLAEFSGMCNMERSNLAGHLAKLRGTYAALARCTKPSRIKESDLNARYYRLRGDVAEVIMQTCQS